MPKITVFKNVFFAIVFLLLIAFPVVADLLKQTRITATGSIRGRFSVGVNYWWAMPKTFFLERDYPLLSNASVSIVRLGAVAFESLDQYDATVDFLVANNIDVLGILEDERLVSDIEAWGNYVQSMVLHFKGRIRCWEIWNEPNWEGFKGNASGYTKFLKAAYNSAKQADPESVVVSGGLLGVESGTRYLTEMYQNGAAGFMDAVAIHPYVDGVSPLEPNKDSSGHTFWQLPQVRSVMVKNGDEGKAIWVTEFGYGTPGGSFYVGDGKTVTESEQALYLTQALELSSTWGWIDRFYVYQWMDAGGEWGYYGLIRGTWDPPYETKLSFDAVKNFIKNLA